MRYTQNINLPIVEDNDLYSKEINNLAFEKIDEEIQSLADIVETLDSPENSIADVKKDINDINEQLEHKANKNINGNYANILDYEEYCENVTANNKVYKCWDNALSMASNTIGWGTIFFPSNTYYFKDSIVISSNIVVKGENWDNTILAPSPNITNKTFITISNSNSGIHDLTISGSDNSNIVGLEIVESKNIYIRNLKFIYFALGNALFANAMNLQLDNLQFWRCKNITFAGSDSGFSNIMASSCLTLYLKGGNNRYQNVSVKGGDIVENWVYTDTYGIEMTGTRNQYNIIECQDAISHGILMKNLSASQCYNILADSNGSGKRKGLPLTNIIGIHIKDYSYDTVVNSISDNYIEDNKTQDIGLKVESTPERLILNHKSIRHENKDIIETKSYQNNYVVHYYSNYNVSAEMTAQTINTDITTDTIDIVFGDFNTENIYTQRIYWKIKNTARLGYVKGGNLTYRNVTITSNGITISDPRVSKSDGTDTTASSNNYVKILKIIGTQNGVYL